MVELVAGYLVAWAARKAKRAGARVDAQIDAALDAGLDRLDEVVTDKLGTDPALAVLRAEAEEHGTTSDLTLRRVNDAVTDAAARDAQFAAALAAVLTRLEEAQQGSGSRIDLRGAQGVQLGNHNTQTNTWSS